MTAALDLHPDPGHPGAVVAAVHEALDELGPVDASVDGVTSAVVGCERAIRRLEALKLRLLAAADAAKVAQTTGHSSTGAWLAAQTRGGQARSAREVRLASSLDRGLPATARALADGSVSTEHAAVIADATAKLPAGLLPTQITHVEEQLVGKAHTLDPIQLRRVARRALEAIEPDVAVVDAHEDRLLEAEEDAARARSRLTLHDNGDGTTTGHFTVPTLAAAALRKVLDSLTAPRRDRGPRTDPAHARGLAFSEVLEHLPTDRLHGKVAATVVVTLDLDTLRGQLRAARLDTGDLVSAAEARRLACNAGLVPAVLGGTSLPLDLGRQQRLFTEAQRLAGATRHTSCAAAACQTPYAWCELHHRRPWSRGGRSDQADMVPLCGHHHRLLHREPGLVRLRT
jgi:hypothetical protein